MRAFVTGGTGFIGSHLVELLVNCGYQVTCTVRETSNLRWLQPLLDEKLPRIQLVTADLSNPDSPIPSLQDVDLVFHLAGLTKAFNADEYNLANAGATKRMIEACLAENRGITRFLYCSSLAASGPSPDGRQISEDTQPQPLTDYGRSKLKGETITREYADRLPITIIRPPAVYGPRDKDIYLFFQCVRKGILPIIGNSQRQLSLVYVKDLVGGIHTAAVSDRAVGETYFLTDGVVHSWWDVAQAISGELKKRPLPLRVPFFLLDVVAIFTEAIAKFTGEPATLNRQKMIDLKQQYWICDSTKAEKEIGYCAKHPLEKGIEETARWYLDNGWL
jgi:dihydroflavonol-4-reductase